MSKNSTGFGIFRFGIFFEIGGSNITRVEMGCKRREKCKKTDLARDER